EEEGKERGGGEEGEVREVVRVDDDDSREPGGHQERYRDQGKELAGACAQCFWALFCCAAVACCFFFFLAGGVARGAGAGGGGCEVCWMLSIRSLASLFERNSCPVTAPWRCSVSRDSCTPMERCSRYRRVSRG